MDIMEVKAEVLLGRNQFRTIITATMDPCPVLNHTPPATTRTAMIMARIFTAVLEQMHNRTPSARTITDSTERLVALPVLNHSRLLRTKDTRVI